MNVWDFFYLATPICFLGGLFLYAASHFVINESRNLLPRVSSQLNLQAEMVADCMIPPQNRKRKSKGRKKRKKGRADADIVDVDLEEVPESYAPRTRSNSQPVPHTARPTTHRPSLPTLGSKTSLSPSIPGSPGSPLVLMKQGIKHSEGFVSPEGISRIQTRPKSNSRSNRNSRLNLLHDAPASPLIPSLTENFPSTDTSTPSSEEENSLSSGGITSRFSTLDTPGASKSPTQAVISIQEELERDDEIVKKDGEVDVHIPPPTEEEEIFLASLGWRKDEDISVEPITEKEKRAFVGSIRNASLRQQLELKLTRGATII